MGIRKMNTEQGFKPVSISNPQGITLSDALYET
jgi:hypothetical protein